MTGSGRAYKTVVQPVQPLYNSILNNMSFTNRR